MSPPGHHHGLKPKRGRGPRGEFMRDGRAPIPSSVSTSRSMSANRGADTIPERHLRSVLREAHLVGYRRNYRGVPGRPDIAFLRNRLAIFLHGCFWHRCPTCRLPLPKTHKAFWREKFQRNVERDNRKLRELRRLGWRVLVVWECRLASNPESVVKRIKRGVS